jgi:eukaryotic-like serine/threonine-protein kinase
MSAESPETLFNAVRRLGDVTERGAYLDRACGDDRKLRTAVERQLATKGDVELHFADDVPAEKAGDVIGRYRLLRPIGQGGFGTVWSADQLEPVRRTVALKIVKLGMDTRRRRGGRTS